MPLNKKIIISFCIFLILFTCFSGCILQDIFGAASFSLDSWNVTDDKGFPAVFVSFTCSGRVNLKTFDTSSNMVDYDFFYGDKNTTLKNTILNIGDYRETLRSGAYSFKVFDKNNKEIFSKALSFKGTSLSIIKCDQQWWEDKNKYTLIGLKIYVQNMGDLPVYPFSADMIAGSETYTGYIVPTVVLPDSSNFIYCILINEEVFDSDPFEIVLKDKDGVSLASGSFNFDVKSSVSTRYYSDGLDKTIAVPYPDFLYDYYSSLDRIVVEDYSVFILDSYDDVYLDFILDRIIESCSRFNLKSDAEKIDYVNGFVQALDYKKDSEVNDSYEYPRYPIETLFNGNGGGDCEDKSILSASLLEKLGYQVALLRLPEHMAVGVKLDKDAVSRYNFYKDGYYFLETTTEGKPLGFIPREYESPSELYVYPIKQTEFVTHNWKNGVVTIFSKTESGDFVKVIAYVENYGNKTAENVDIKGIFYYDKNLESELTSESITVGDISAFDKKKVILSVSLPGLSAWFETRVIINGKIVDTQKSSDKFD
jgi:predicted transglutaminase-like cysteine proteinase